MPGTSVKLYGRRKEEAAAAGEDARLEALAGEDEGYDEYIPLKERRRREAERRAGKLGKNRRDRERERLEQERCVYVVVYLLLEWWCISRFK